MTVPRERYDKLKAAGVVMHQYHRTPGVYTRIGVAVCGAKRQDGAEFTVWSKYVSCAACREVITARREQARRRFSRIVPTPGASP